MRGKFDDNRTEQAFTGPVWLVRHFLFIYLWKYCVSLQVLVTPHFPSVRRIVLLPGMKCAVQIKFDLI